LVYFFSTKSRLIFSPSVSFSLVCFSVRFVLFAFDDCFASMSSKSSLLCSYYVSVLALSREVLFRARALLLEKKRISIDYRRLCGLLPRERRRRRNKRRFAFWVRVCRIKILSLREKERRRERMITALSLLEREEETLLPFSFSIRAVVFFRAVFVVFWRKKNSEEEEEKRRKKSTKKHEKGGREKAVMGNEKTQNVT
jgi:hypothetical protein